jgi:bacterioferritin
MRSIKTPKDDFPRIIELLNQVLKLEYSLIIHYPRIASYIDDEETKEMVIRLCEYSMPHADVIAKAIRELGGEPIWNFDPFPELASLIPLFRVQLDKEKLALSLHTETANLVPNPMLRDKIARMANEEKEHIKLVETILSRLGEKEESY